MLLLLTMIDQILASLQITVTDFQQLLTKNVTGEVYRRFLYTICVPIKLFKFSNQVLGTCEWSKDFMKSIFVVIVSIKTLGAVLAV